MRPFKLPVSICSVMLLLSSCAPAAIATEAVPLFSSPVAAQPSQPAATPTLHVPPTWIPDGLSGKTSSPSGSVENTAPIPGPLDACERIEASPYGGWTSGFCEADEIRLVNIATGVRWVISYSKDYGRRVGGSNGFLDPIHWTADGRYIFLGVAPSVSGPIYYTVWRGVFRLDLLTGKTGETLPSTGAFAAISFSPDGKKMAIIQWPRRPDDHISLNVKIVNVQNGERLTYPIPEAYNQAGDLVWSPDGERIALGAAGIDYDGTGKEKFAVFTLDLTDGSIRRLIPDQAVEIHAWVWPKEDELELKNNSGQWWIYHFEDQSLRPK
jgi:hypothetical protein